MHVERRRAEELAGRHDRRDLCCGGRCGGGIHFSRLGMDEHQRARDEPSSGQAWAFVPVCVISRLETRTMEVRLTVRDKLTVLTLPASLLPFECEIDELTAQLSAAWSDVVESPKQGVSDPLQSGLAGGVWLVSTLAARIHAPLAGESYPPCSTRSVGLQKEAHGGVPVATR